MSSSNSFTCFLDRPSAYEPVATSVGGTTRHKVYYAGVHQPCELTIGGAIFDRITVEISTLLQGSFGIWELTPERNKLILFEVNGLPLSFFLDDSMTCVFRRAGVVLQTFLLLIKIVPGYSQNDYELLNWNTDLSRAFRQSGYNPEKSYGHDDDMPIGRYISY